MHKKFLRTSAVVLIGAIAIATPLRTSAMTYDWEGNDMPIKPITRAKSYSDYFESYHEYPARGGLACVMELKKGEKKVFVPGRHEYWKSKIGESHSNYGTITHWEDREKHTSDSTRIESVTWYECKNCGKKSEKEPWDEPVVRWRENPQTLERTYTLPVKYYPGQTTKLPCSRPKSNLDDDMLAIYENMEFANVKIPKALQDDVTVQWAIRTMELGNSAKDLDLKCRHKPKILWTYTINTPGCMGNCCSIL